MNNTHNIDPSVATIVKQQNGNFAVLYAKRAVATDLTLAEAKTQRSVYSTPVKRGVNDAGENVYA